MNRLVHLFWLALFLGSISMTSSAQEIGSSFRLPTPDLKGSLSLEQALHRRRSIRNFSPVRLTQAEISQLLWAAQGITNPEGLRTTPSAGALMPLEIYLAVGNVAGLAAGLYHYHPQTHALMLVQNGDMRSQLAAASLNQAPVREAPAVLIIAAVLERTQQRYGGRAQRYVHMEAGHAAQNVYLQTTASGLATVLIGAFDDASVQAVLGLPSDHAPLGLMPIGRKP